MRIRRVPRVCYPPPSRSDRGSGPPESAADPAGVRAVMTEETRATFGADLESLTAQMPGFADAIAPRRLDVYTECYAEYTYATGTRTLSFALAAQDDGVWKLVRF